MKKIVLFFLFTGCYFLFTSCNTATPEKYFNTAILSCNMMNGFASGALQRELESPSVKMIDGNKDNFAPMKRKEIVDSKIEYIESNLEKLSRLKVTDDSREIMQASLALYNYVLPVYKNGYRQLAKLYDEEAPQDEILQYTQSIQEKYFPKFEQLYSDLITAGKAYAKKHAIKVRWDIETSPR